MNRDRRKRRIGVEQCGFLQKWNKKSNIHDQNDNRAKQKKMDAYTGVIDYTETFDKLRHKDQLNRQKNSIYLKTVILEFIIYTVSKPPAYGLTLN